MSDVKTVGATDAQEFLYRFNEDELRVVQARFIQYMQAVQVIAEMHGLDKLGFPLTTDPENNGFLLLPGIKVQKGESK